MSQITELDEEISEALGRLRAALAARDAQAAAAAEGPDPRERITALEGEKAELADELSRLQAKRDKDVAALDDLIAQLKPLIQEVGDA
jgi:predicted nuclease with TOPRIM domain